MATIFYIEDEPDLRDGIAECLTAAGHEVLTASDGCEGLKMILAHKPDLVISDIYMPNMNGWELLTEIKKKFSEFDAPPFLFFTALFDEPDKTKGLELGAVDYLTKPLDLDVLLSKVNALLPQNGGLTGKKEMQPA